MNDLSREKHLNLSLQGFIARQRILGCRALLAETERMEEPCRVMVHEIAHEEVKQARILAPLIVGQDPEPSLYCSSKGWLQRFWGFSSKDPSVFGQLAFKILEAAYLKTLSRVLMITEQGQELAAASSLALRSVGRLRFHFLRQRDGVGLTRLEKVYVMMSATLMFYDGAAFLHRLGVTWWQFMRTCRGLMNQEVEMHWVDEDSAKDLLETVVQPG